jgi:hypothetical protein
VHCRGLLHDHGLCRVGADGTCKADTADGTACDTILGPGCITPARCVIGGVGSGGTCEIPAWLDLWLSNATGRYSERPRQFRLPVGHAVPHVSMLHASSGLEVGACREYFHDRT